MKATNPPKEIYLIVSKTGSIFEPAYYSKRQAKKARRDVCMPNPKETHIMTIVMANPK